jgi:hypothetical protein
MLAGGGGEENGIGAARRARRTRAFCGVHVLPQIFIRLPIDVAGTFGTPNYTNYPSYFHFLFD